MCPVADVNAVRHTIVWSLLNIASVKFSGFQLYSLSCYINTCHIVFWRYAQFAHLARSVTPVTCDHTHDAVACMA